MHKDTTRDGLDPDPGETVRLGTPMSNDFAQDAPLTDAALQPG
jgi:hypothetical protein